MESCLGKRKHTVAVPPSLTKYLERRLATCFEELKEQIAEHFAEQDADNENKDSSTVSSGDINEHGQFFVDALLEELFRYLYLLAKYPTDAPIQASPSELVDEALHELLLDPLLYLRVCDAIMTLRGMNVTDHPVRLLPHNPRGGKNRAQQIQRLRRTHSDYLLTFQHAPPDNIWPRIPCCDDLTGLPVHTLNGRPGFLISIRSLTGKTLPVRVESDFNAYTLMKRIHDWDGLPPDQQRLIFNGHQLDASSTLRDYDIGKDAIIHVVLKLRGC